MVPLLVPLLWKYRIMYGGISTWSIVLAQIFPSTLVLGCSKNHGLDATQYKPALTGLRTWQTWEEGKKWLFICIATTLSHFKLTHLGLLSCGKWVNLFFLSTHRLRLCTPEGYPAARTFVPLWKLALLPQQHFPMGDHSKISWCSWIPPLCPGLSGYGTFLKDSYPVSLMLCLSN